MTPLFWRALYGLLERTWFLRAVKWALSAVDAVSRRPIADGLIAMVERRLVNSGWPHQNPAWINIHVSRFCWRLRRIGVARPVAKRAHTACREHLRIGFVGAFSGLLGFPREWFAACPPRVAVYIFDVEYRGCTASYLRPLVASYVAGSRPDIDPSLAEAINRTDIDMLINIGRKVDSYAVIDAAMTPCIAQYCSGSDLLHNDKVDLQLCWQPQADYPLTPSGMFCSTTERPWPFGRVRQIRGVYDRRGIDVSRVPPWDEREPVIVFHGTLNKLEHPAYLAAVFSLLQQDSSLQFVFMGKDAPPALRTITEEAKRAGVDRQVHYEGIFSGMRSEDGSIEDPGWLTMMSLLRRARLNPDPWPMGGGSSRLETYLAGAPSVHMGLRVDRASWRRRQHSVCDLPLLEVPAATATTTDEYLALCRRCLYEPEFADEVIAEQLRVAAAATDPRQWWDELVEVYDEWHAAHTNCEGRPHVAITA